MEKINLLHTEWSDGWGGQEIRILAESKEFVKRGYGVTIAAQPNSQLLSNAKKSNIPTISVTMKKGINIATIFKLFLFIRRNKINIVHTHSSVDSRTAGIAAKLSGAIVVRSRHISIPVSNNYLTWFQYMRLADRLITSGESIKQNLINKNNMLPDNIISIPAGVDETRFTSDAKSKSIRSEFNISDNDFVVGMVSVLRSWKGHEFVIRSMSKLVEIIPNIRLLIVGDGPIRDQIIELINDLSLEKYIILAGHHYNPVPFYQSMDVVILPSYKGEATSQTLPQAMLMNIPVISTNIGGLSEVVINNKTGLVVPIKDSDAIYKSIEKIYFDDDLKFELVQNAKKHALNNFTFDKMINSTEKVYIDLLYSKNNTQSPP